MKNIYMYLTGTMADWESGYLLQALTLQKFLPEQKYRLVTFALSGGPVKTAGGMTLLPDISLEQLNEDEAAALLLIGADTWLEPEHVSVLDMAWRFLERGLVVAAICGATLGLAETGLLNMREHTSNAPFFLSMSKNYTGASYYREKPSVADGNLITASSAGSLDWARLILERLEVFTPETMCAWHSYFATGNPRFFGELMETFSTTPA